MIAPQELRMGNFVHSPYDGHVVKVNAADIFLIANGHHREARFEPIELTEDWLLKFGFEIDYMNRDILICAYYGENPVTKDYILELKNTSDGWFYRNGYFKIKTVHQLQNLTFALTGEELTIK